MIISSFANAIDYEFEGYCFSGNDYIAGAEGHRAYVQSGGSVPPGLDGCYAIAQDDDDGVIIGTDARGLRRLFLYEGASAWAVGTSLYELVEHLRLHGIDPEPCLPVLTAFGVRKSFTAQLNTLQTIFQGITLVPSYCAVRIDRGGPRVFLLESAVHEESYEENLQKYVETWLSRFQTLSSHPDSLFTIDLSGGLDSRLVFAFALASGALKEQPGRFRVISQKNLPDDFAAATNIADKHGVSLNYPRGEVIRGESTTANAVSSWRDTCLGLYLPVYLSPHQFDPLSIKGHGAGGGTFRDIFTEATLERRLESLSPEMREDLHGEYRDLAVTSLSRIAAERPQVPVGKLLYREFRNRFHFGHAPHRRPMYSPVNSILTDSLADRPDFDPNNIYFDALDCLVPGLKNEPYDKASKSPARPAPSAAAMRIQKIDVEPGSVYAPETLPRTKPVSARGAFEELYSTARDSVLEDGVRELIGDHEVIDRCEAAIESALGGEKPLRANHPDHKDVSFVLAAAFAAGAPIRAS